MLRPLALFFALVWWSGVESAGLTCNVHAQCSDGYFCANSFCQKCIQCSDLKREQPFPTPCVKSVRDCGGCLKGLVVDLKNDVNAECVPPESGEPVESLPTYFWPVFVVCLLLFTLVVGVVVYVLRNPETFRIIKASTRTSVESPFIRSGGSGAAAAATAPAPPAYEDACYTALRPHSPPRSPPRSPFAPASPPAPHNPHNPFRAQDNEWSFPVSKQPSPSPPAAPGREAAGTQAARVFNLPAYMRDQPLPSPEGATVTELEHDTSFTHDEETVESLWTPNNTSHNDDSNSNAIASGAPSGAEGAAGGGGAPEAGPPALLAAARDANKVEPSPPKILCVRQETNNNRGVGSGSNSGARVVVNNFNVDFYASLQIDNSK